uniref:V-ATPase 14 kDa subunit n=1 Tax=Acanthochromis polyacanthus TaxID=80966 RepID=A0A3Q1GV51_9TELE
MAGRGKLIAVIGDEDTCTGFLLGGIGELNKNRKPNFLVVEKDTNGETGPDSVLKMSNLKIKLSSNSLTEYIKYTYKDWARIRLKNVLDQIPFRNHLL